MAITKTMGTNLTVAKYSWGDALLDNNVFINGFKTEKEMRDWVRARGLTIRMPSR